MVPWPVTFAFVPSLEKARELRVRRTPDDFELMASKKIAILLGDPSTSKENPAVPAVVPCGKTIELWNTAFAVTLYFPPNWENHCSNVTIPYWSGSSWFIAA